MQVQKVKILRDETTVLDIAVPAWEVPILEAKHGEERITLGDLVLNRRAWPDSVEGEFERLSRAYGVTGSGDNAQSFCERVYGGGRVGMKRLGEVIAEAKKEAAAAEKKAAKASEKQDLLGAG